MLSVHDGEERRCDGASVQHHSTARWTWRLSCFGRRGRLCHLTATVYGGATLPLPAERHPRQQRDHLQRHGPRGCVEARRRAPAGLGSRALQYRQ